MSIDPIDYICRKHTRASDGWEPYYVAGSEAYSLCLRNPYTVGTWEYDLWELGWRDAYTTANQQIINDEEYGRYFDANGPK